MGGSLDLILSETSILIHTRIDTNCDSMLEISVPHAANLRLCLCPVLGDVAEESGRIPLIRWVYHLARLVDDPNKTAPHHDTSPRGPGNVN